MTIHAIGSIENPTIVIGFDCITGKLIFIGGPEYLINYEPKYPQIRGVMTGDINQLVEMIKAADHTGGYYYVKSNTFKCAIDEKTFQYESVFPAELRLDCWVNYVSGGQINTSKQIVVDKGILTLKLKDADKLIGGKFTYDIVPYGNNEVIASGVAVDDKTTPEVDISIDMNSIDLKPRSEYTIKISHLEIGDMRFTFIT